MHYRQGDVLVTRVPKIPNNLGAIDREHGAIILAHGEVTGHAHAIHANQATLYGRPDIDDRFLQVLADGGVDLTHEEHATIHLPAGDYIVRRQREYSPEAIRNIAD